MILTQIASQDLEQVISNLSLTAVIWGSAILLVLIFLAILFANRVPKTKAPLFILILITVLGTSFTISGSTVYLNLKADSGGPVHWHADFEIWACGNELELRDPTGLLSNKIGTPTLHEHNDKRIHLEGVPVDLPKDASLGKFMTVIGGEISNDTLVVPLNDDKIFEDTQIEQDGDGAGAQAPELLNDFIRTKESGKVAAFTNGQACGTETAEVQVFVYQFDAGTKTYTQKKLDQPASYGIAQHSEVPPGDCIIMEFGPLKDRTDKLCKQYGVRDKNRCAAFGVTADKHSVCENTEVNGLTESEKHCQEQAKNPVQGISKECDDLQRRTQ